MNAIRVMLVDDHQLVRRGLRAILDPDPRFRVVGEAASGKEALRLVAETLPDVVLLDLGLGDLSAVELCELLIQSSPETAVIILTAYLDHNLLDACLRAGARGYLLKDAENMRLAEQILTVVDGHVALDPRAADVLVDYVRRGDPIPEPLSPREIEVLRLIAQGQTNKEIAHQLGLSDHTIKGYAKQILAKLEVHTRVEAVLRARERGWL